MNKIWKKVLASSLAFICTVTAGVAAVATNGFGLFNAAQVEGVEHNKQLSFGNFFGNGIMLTASAETNTVTLAERDLAVVDNFNDVAFGRGRWHNQSDYRDSGSVATTANHIISVQGGETLHFEQNISDKDITYYAIEITSISESGEGVVSSNAPNWSEWQTGDLILQSDTRYILVSAKFVEGGSFTSDDHANLKNCFSLSPSGSTTPSTPSTEPVYPMDRYTLKATVNDEATDKRVTWSIEWRFPSDSWVQQGLKKVMEYINLTPTSEYSLEASLELVKKFGSPVVVKVQSVSNPELYAACYVDCFKEVESVNFKFDNAVNISNGQAGDFFTSKFYSTSGDITITDVPFTEGISVYPYNYVFSEDGTINADIKEAPAFCLSVDTEVLNAINSATGYTFTVNPEYAGTPDYNYIEGIDITATKSGTTNYTGRCVAFADMIYYEDYPVDYDSAAYGALLTYLRDNPTVALFKLHVETFPENADRDVFDLKIYFDSTLLGNAVTELSMNVSQVTFK